MIKEIARKGVQHLLKTKDQDIDFNKPVLLFPFYNKILYPVIKQAKIEGCNILFLPYVVGGYKFEWQNKSVGYFNSAEFQEHYFRFFYEIALDYMKEYKVDYFITDKVPLNNIFILSAISAANVSCPKTKTVYLEHGHTGVENPYMNFWFLDNFDYFYAADKFKKDYLIEDKKKLKKSTKVKQWVRTLNLPSKKKKNKNTKILVAMGFNNGDRLAQLFPDTLRYKVNMVIADKLNELAEIKKIKVVWKGIKKSNELYDPIPKYLKENCSSIVYQDGANIFMDELLESNLLITDSISTPLYESCFLKVPVVCIRSSKAAKVRADVHEKFKKIIYFYDNLEEVEANLFKAVYENLNKIDNIPEIETQRDAMPWEEE